MHKQKGLAPILIVFLIVLILGGFLIYSGKIIIIPSQNTVPYEVYKSKSPASTPVSQSSASAETANWKTYNFNLFSLKLPQGWSEYRSENPIQLVNYQVGEIGSGFSPQLDKGKLKIEIYTQETKQSLTDYVSQQKAQTIETRGTGWSWVESNLSVDGQPAIKVKSSSPGFVVYTQNPQKTKVFQIAFALDFDNNQTLTDQILSNFKFTQ